jgi:hypothetical protein
LDCVIFQTCMISLLQQPLTFCYSLITQFLCTVQIIKVFAMHTLQECFSAMLQGAIAHLLPHPVKLNTCNKYILCLAAIIWRHPSLVATLNNRSLQPVAHTLCPILSPKVHYPFLAHGQPCLYLSSMKLRWKVHLGGDMLRLRTLLAGRTNTKIYICLRVQDCLQV